MATSLQNMSNYNPDIVPNAQGMCFGIVVSDYNADITYALLDGCYETLLNNGASSENIFVIPNFLANKPGISFFL